METSYNEHDQHIRKTWSTIVRTIIKHGQTMIKIVKLNVNIVKQVIKHRQTHGKHCPKTCKHCQTQAGQIVQKHLQIIKKW
jgi:hypothetical protein